MPFAPAFWRGISDNRFLCLLAETTITFFGIASINQIFSLCSCFRLAPICRQLRPHSLFASFKSGTYPAECLTENGNYKHIGLTGKLIRSGAVSRHGLASDPRVSDSFISQKHSIEPPGQILTESYPTQDDRKFKHARTFRAPKSACFTSSISWLQWLPAT